MIRCQRLFSALQTARFHSVCVLAMGLLCLGGLSLSGTAAAQGGLDSAPYAAPAEDGSFYVIAHGGRHILSRDTLVTGIPAIQLSSFSSYDISLLTAQHESRPPRVTFARLDCGGTACWEIRHLGDDEHLRSAVWVLSTLRTETGNGLQSQSMQVKDGTPVWIRGPAAGHGQDPYEVFPRLVLTAHPSLADAWTIREYAWSAASRAYEFTGQMLANSDDPTRNPPLIWTADKAANQSFWSDFYMLPASPDTDWTVWRVKAHTSSCTEVSGTQCYWMENQTGNYCWVASVIFSAPTIGDCYALDSCNGGLGQSGGGCYKWADCSGCERAAWN